MNFENASMENKEIIDPENEFISCLNDGHISRAVEIKSWFKISEEFISSSEVYEAAKSCFISKLNNGEFPFALKIKEIFKIPEEFVNSSEVQELVKNGFISKLKRDYNTNVEIAKKFDLFEDFIKESIKREFIS